MSEVWIHWNIGHWYLTENGITLIEKVQDISLRDVRFVIDRVGLNRARERRRRSTCAWAVGMRIPESEPVPDGALHRLRFRWQTDEHFHVNGIAVSGCGYLYGTIGLEGEAKTVIMLPKYGDTVREQVQQYGRVR